MVVYDVLISEASHTKCEQARDMCVPKIFWASNEYSSNVCVCVLIKQQLTSLYFLEFIKINHAVILFDVSCRGAVIHLWYY